VAKNGCCIWKRAPNQTLKAQRNVVWAGSCGSLKLFTSRKEKSCNWKALSGGFPQDYCIGFAVEVVFVYCRVMECEVVVELGRCSLQVGSLLGRSSCPYMESLVCPLTGKGKETLVEAK